MYKAVSPVSV